MKTQKIPSILLSFVIFLLSLTVGNLALASTISAQPLETTDQVQVQYLAAGLPLSVDDTPFPVTLDLKNAQIRGIVPKKLVETQLTKALNKYDNYQIKHTRYNKQTIKNLDFRSIDNGGLTVAFSVNLKHRELIANTFGNRIYTPPISVTLHGKSSFGLNIRNNVVNVSYRGHNVKGQNWYTDIASSLDSVFKKQTSAVIKRSLNRFNSRNLVSLLKQGGIDKKLPFNLTIDKLVKSGVNVNADISPEGLSFVINLPQTIDIA